MSKMYVAWSQPPALITKTIYDGVGVQLEVVILLIIECEFD